MPGMKSESWGHTYEFPCGRLMIPGQLNSITLQFRLGNPELPAELECSCDDIVSKIARWRPRLPPIRPFSAGSGARPPPRNCNPQTFSYVFSWTIILAGSHSGSRVKK